LRYRTNSETAQLEIKFLFPYLNRVNTTYLKSAEDSNTFQPRKW